MATVPPGNKQIVELSVVSVLSADKQVVTALQIEQGAVVAPTTAPPVLPVNNKLVGELTTISVVGSINSSIIANQLQGCAVVFYSLPTTITNYQLEGLAVVDGTPKAPISPVNNKFVGELSAVAVAGCTADFVEIFQLQGYAVVKEYHPRKELTIFNVEYAADAEFNQTPPQGAN